MSLNERVISMREHRGPTYQFQWLMVPFAAYYAVADRGEIDQGGCEISSLVEHMGLSPWLFL